MVKVLMLLCSVLIAGCFPTASSDTIPSSPNSNTGETVVDEVAEGEGDGDPADPADAGEVVVSEGEGEATEITEGEGEESTEDAGCLDNDEDGEDDVKYDICVDEDRYNDGICDNFCLNPDPDCECEDDHTHGNHYGRGHCSHNGNGNGHEK